MRKEVIKLLETEGIGSGRPIDTQDMNYVFYVLKNSIEPTEEEIKKIGEIGKRLRDKISPVFKIGFKVIGVNFCTLSKTKDESWTIQCGKIKKEKVTLDQIDKMIGFENTEKMKV